MPRPARERLLDLATELDIPIIEDSAYAALRFEGEAIPAIQALDVARSGSLDAARTIYCGTFSKTMSPGLRIGWIVAGKPLIRRLVLVKQASDLNSANVNQMVMHKLIEGAYERKVTAARAHYCRRRDAMLAALSEHMPAGTTWTEPQGGLFVWVRLPDGCDGATLLDRAVKEARVAFVPGAAFFFDGRGRNTIRLSYSLPDEGTIREGIRRLASLI
jgi:DNA-binding transcriptional MocR family regulator